MNAGRDQWILFCLDDFNSNVLNLDVSTLLENLVSGDREEREAILEVTSSREKERLFKEVMVLEKSLTA